MPQVDCEQGSPLQSFWQVSQLEVRMKGRGKIIAKLKLPDHAGDGHLNLGASGLQVTAQAIQRQEDNAELIQID